MTDPVTQLAFLRTQRDLAPDAATRAMFDALIAEKEAAASPTAPRSHTQHIREYTSIAAAVAGDVHGDIYIVGERAESTTALLAGYLRWLTGQCGQLPLRGVREQKTATDVLNISLDQVYTQLAVRGRVQRDVFAGAALHTLDIEDYIKRHTGDDLLPWQHRSFWWRPLTPDEQKDIQRDALHMRSERPNDAIDSASNLPTGMEGFLADLDLDAFRKTLRVVNEVRFLGPQLVSEAIAAGPRLVLLGEPGSGKSTALRYLALMLARAGLDASVDLPHELAGWQILGKSGNLIPLFMPLLPLAQRLAAQPGRNGTAVDLWTVIDAHLANHGATTDMITAMRAELARGHVLLLLDGLDEVAGETSRRQVIDAVQAFATEQPHCRMVVACRVRAYLGEQNAAWQLPGWSTATLADWTPGQVRAFIGAWYTAAAAASRMPDAKRDDRISLLQRAVTERDDLRRLSIRPLLLTIMALVHLNDGRLPEDRVTLYSRCLDILLGQWEIAGKDETVYGTLMQYIGLPDADVKSLRPLLARVAYAAHTAAAAGEVGRLRRADLRELVADALEQLKHPEPHRAAKRFLEYTDVRAGLLQATEAGDAYAFPHQTFQEYLAGLELISGVGFVDRIMERRSEDRWRVPIFLGIGHAVSEGLFSVPYQLLSRLLHLATRDEAQHQRDLVIAAEIAEDVGWDRLERSGAEFVVLRAALAYALAQVAEGSALPAAERVYAGMLLGRLGDPRPGVCTLPPDMLPIAGGSFLIGNTKAELRALGKENDNWFSDTINNRPVPLASFELARYPVTNAQYALFMDDDGYNPQQPWWNNAGKIWFVQDDDRSEEPRVYQPRHFKNRPEYWDNERFGIARPNHPVVGVSWYEAIAFCGWLTQTLNDGWLYTLPSEAEWEYAARGTERRVFPWGADEPDGEHANFDGTNNGTTAVGCFATGATPEGLLDMVGNIWEWTRSVFTAYPYDSEDGRETPDNPAEKRFTLRGGGWFDPSILLRASNRDDDAPGSLNDDVGFRLARHHKV